MRSFLTLIILLIFFFSCSSKSGRIISSAELTGYRYLERARRDLNRQDDEGFIKNIEMALEHSQRNNLPYLKAYIYLEKAVFFANLNPNLAEKNLQLAEEIINREAKDLEPYFKLNKSVLLFTQNRKEEAKKMLESIENLPKDLKNHYLTFKALILKEEDKYEEFNKTFNQVLKNTKKDEDYFLTAYLYRLRASYSESKGLIADAINDYKNSLEVDRIINNNKQIIKTLEIIGDLYYKVNDKNNAFYFYYQGWELLQSIGDYKNSKIFLEKAYSCID